MVAFCSAGGGAPPSSVWHILIASIRQLPGAASDICMFGKPGGCAFVLEHDAVQVATVSRIASARAGRDRLFARIIRTLAHGFRLRSRQSRPRALAPAARVQPW